MSAGSTRVALAKVSKSEEFLLVASFAFEGGTYDAAASLAVSAAINASDALCAMRGRVPSGRDHQDAVQSLRRNGFQQASNILARVLAIKQKSQYSARRVSRSEADDAVKRAERLLELAKDLLHREEGQANG